ncbi:hypothetical protein HanRHA438_Chr16g0737471 [Helianthus annuus]|nr:hypothetical protein HanRHA438_Chr16g0737471 [Helianthus annuus]
MCLFHFFQKKKKKKKKNWTRSDYYWLITDLGLLSANFRKIGLLFSNLPNLKHERYRSNVTEE